MLMATRFDVTLGLTHGVGFALKVRSLAYRLKVHFMAFLFVLFPIWSAHSAETESYGRMIRAAWVLVIVLVPAMAIL